MFPDESVTSYVTNCSSTPRMLVSIAGVIILAGPTRISPSTLSVAVAPASTYTSLTNTVAGFAPSIVIIGGTESTVTLEVSCAVLSTASVASATIV